MKTKDLEQKAEFNATPHELYEILMNWKKHANMTKAKCSIIRKVGGKFHCYDHYIEGEILELIPDKKIVQKWRNHDFPAEHYSIATFEFEKNGKKTILKFSQKGIPEKLYEDLNKGWKEHYWNKMKTYIAKKYPSAE